MIQGSNPSLALFLPSPPRDVFHARRKECGRDSDPLMNISTKKSVRRYIRKMANAVTDDISLGRTPALRVVSVPEDLL
jgi:hypothetical protein